MMYSQQSELDNTLFPKLKTYRIGNDTIVGLSIPQCKFLLKKYYEVNKYRSLDSVCERQIAISDSMITNYAKIQATYDLIIVNNTEKSTIRELQIKKLNEAIKEKDKAIQRQKIYKWMAIGGGAILSGYLGYKVINQ